MASPLIPLTPYELGTIFGAAGRRAMAQRVDAVASMHGTSAKEVWLAVWATAEIAGRMARSAGARAGAVGLLRQAV